MTKDTRGQKKMSEDFLIVIPPPVKEKEGFFYISRLGMAVGGVY